jgi:2-methylcitrate dehydratase PrpD
VRLATKSGAVHEQEVEYVPGDIRRPLGDGEIKDKFRRFAMPVLGQDGAGKLLGLAAAALDDGAAAQQLFGALEQACVACADGANSRN